jgi:hypothetical protein
VHFEKPLMMGKSTEKKQTKTRKSKSSITPIVKKIKKGGKIALAAGKIVRDFNNPINQAKMISRAAQGKGLVYPGTKYIGPGNPMNLGEPVSAGDAVAMKHDFEYGRLLEKGVKPWKLYAGFSEADKRAMKEADVTAKHGLAIYMGMAVKKGLYKAGLTGKLIKD